jgi:putative nucleotidyltransferase with HDIG domain
MYARDLVRGAVRLFALPKPYRELRRLQQNGEASSASISHALKNDPALCAQVLKIANSSLYGLKSKIDTISRAVTIIGQDAVLNLVLATTSIQMFSRYKLPTFDIQKYWEHSIRTAILSQELAKTCNVLQTESYFVAGLLHDIGTMVIAVKLPELSRALYMRLPDDLSPKYEIEYQSLGFTHADVAGELFSLWTFPDHLIDAVKNHHAPEQAEISPLSAALVQIACAYSQMDDKASQDLIGPLAWQITNLDRAMVETISSDLEMVYQDTVHGLVNRVA